MRCSSGWRASWVGGQVLGKGCRSGRQSQWRWTNSTSHKSSNSWLPGWAVSEAILPALLFALALGDWSAESNRRAMTLSAGWHTTLFPPGARRNGAVAGYRGYKDTRDCRSLSPDMIPKMFTLRILLQTEIRCATPLAGWRFWAGRIRWWNCEQSRVLFFFFFFCCRRWFCFIQEGFVSVALRANIFPAHSDAH